MLWGLVTGWLAVNVVVCLYLVASAQPRHPALPRDRRRTLTVATLVVVLLAALAGAGASSTAASWRPWPLIALLATLAVASDVLPIRTSFFRTSGSFLAIVLAAALLGPAPAVALGVLATAVDAVVRRSPALNLLVNLTGFAVFPLVTGLALRALEPATGPAVFAAGVLVATVAANLASFLLVAAPMCVVRRRPLRPLLRETWLPMAPWTVVTGLTLSATILAVEMLGTEVVGLAVVTLVALQLASQPVVERRQRVRNLPLRPEIGT